MSDLDDLRKNIRVNPLLPEGAWFIATEKQVAAAFVGGIVVIDNPLRPTPPPKETDLETKGKS